MMSVTSDVNKYQSTLMLGYISEDGEIEEGEQVSDNNEESSQFVPTKPAGRKELCGVCSMALFKYTCPRCQVKSCGITCLNKHKRNRNCSGVADPYGKIQTGTEQVRQKQVEKDYLFVKQMLSQADKVKKTLSGVEGISQQPKRFRIMRFHARERHNIKLLNAPPVIERHRQNISFFFVKDKTFYWVVELLYWRPDKKGGNGEWNRHLTQPVCDIRSLMEIMPESFLSRELLQMGINSQKKAEFKAFWEVRDRQNKQRRVLEVNIDFPLEQVLKNKTIYEYPTFYLVHQSLQANFLSERTLEEVSNKDVVQARLS